MKGGIYSRDKCPICGSSFFDNGNALICLNHKNIKGGHLYVKFDNIYHRFKTYQEASRFLTGLRFKDDENTLDERDYKKNNPLGFTNMSNKFLASIKPKTAKNIKFHIDYAQIKFENRNVKDLKCGDFEDMLREINVSDKTKNNMVSTLHTFYVWMFDREEIQSLPKFPKIEYVEGYRQTTDKETQRVIIEEVKRIAPIKVYLGIKWLATYFSVRPAEMINIKEGEIDLGNGQLYFPTPKEREFKGVPIMQEDIDILKQFTFTFPTMRFFRHDGGIKGTRKDQPYGEKYFYKWFKRACSNLGIGGLDLYGGTTHTTVRALRKYYSPEQIKEASMRKTGKAFKHYLGNANDDEILSIYKKGAEVIPISEGATKVLLSFEGVKSAK